MERRERQTDIALAFLACASLVGMVLFACIGVLWFSDKVKAPSGGGGGGAH